jgi:hypothetical protein
VQEKPDDRPDQQDAEDRERVGQVAQQGDVTLSQGTPADW